MQGPMSLPVKLTPILENLSKGMTPPNLCSGAILCQSFHWLCQIGKANKKQTDHVITMY